EWCMYCLSPEKSCLAQLKVKRRSNVGVRSSPETNSLIRYIAQQRMKTPPTTPQENMSPVSQHPSLTSPPSKRCCTARTLGECVEEIREATTPVLKRTATILKQQQNTEVTSSHWQNISVSDGGNVNSTMKKQVRFGILLPPELFDKNLPPSTPLRKGGTPVRAPTSAGGSQLRSLLKTPLTLPRPDFSSPSLTGASPPLAMGPCCGEQESTHTQGKVPVNHQHTCECIQIDPILMPPLTVYLSSYLSYLSLFFQQPEEKSEPVKKRSSRTAAKSACGRMKVGLAKHFFGKKAVDRSLYGKRDYASKNPTLSPITEIQSSLNTTPAAEPSDGPSVDCQSPVGSTTTDSSGTGRAAQIWRRWSGPTKTSRTKRQSVIRVGRGKGRKVSVPVDNWLSEETEEQVKNFDTEQDPTETTQREVLVSSPAKHTVPGNREGEPNTHCRRSSIYASSVIEEEQASQPNGPQAVENDNHGSGMELGNVIEQASTSYPDSLLPLWAQKEFNIDDVLRPLPCRGHQSVRRSLRNQSSTLEASGLTRRRRSSIHALLHPPLEEVNHTDL
uniref:Cell division cycle-associated protein 2 n=1 Tax=Oncorhynchus kisutch TaxID=8019 RepID=A0A8C7F7V6_ONCKI